MTYGIDVSRYQAGLDLSALKNDQFVMIKLGGTNILPMYTSSTAKTQASRARAAGKKVGFYWVSGGGPSVAEQARYAVNALRSVGYRDGDLVALDDEVLDSNGQIWNDDKAAAWLISVRGALGCSYKNLALYGSTGSLFRPRVWPKVKKLGVLIWAAAYNSDIVGGVDMGRTGLPWHIHQYTSSYHVQGMSVDRNWMRASVGSVFRPYKTSGKPAPAKPDVPGKHVVLPKTTVERTGNPGNADSVAWMRCQLLAQKGGYSGPIDGHLGAYSWEGIQAYLKAQGLYHGDVDGDPGVLTISAFQAWGGVHQKNITRTSHPDLIGRTNWRIIAKRLNAL